MDYEFFDSSEKATTTPTKTAGVKKYPWKEVPLGKSFTVPRENIKFNVLRSLASRTGKEVGRKFRVIDHGQGPYEVAHVRQTEEEAVKSSKNVVEALGKQIIPAETFDPNYPITPELARYARENGLTNAQAQAKLIADGVTPWALKGMMNKKEGEQNV